MNNAEIYDWLITAFSEPVTGLAEQFYYDKKDRTFYSIHPLDYLMLHEDLTRDESVSSSYSNDISKLIADKIYREEKGDEDIVAIPRLGVVDRKAMMTEFISLVGEEALLDILRQRIDNQDGSQRFDFYFGVEASDGLKKQWQLFKRDRLVPIIGQFMEGNGIEIEKSKVWNVGNDPSISIKLG